LPQGFKNSPTIFGTSLASDLKAFLANQHGCTLLQYIDDLLFAGPSQEDCMEGTCLLLYLLRRQDIKFPKRKLRFARILSNTSVFTCHKNNVDWALRGNRPSVALWPPRPIDRLENF
jgi:hypothetical protein